MTNTFSRTEIIAEIAAITEDAYVYLTPPARRAIDALRVEAGFAGDGELVALIDTARSGDRAAYRLIAKAMAP